MRADIRAAGYDRIKTFGAGADLSVREWNDYIQQMVQLGVFETAYDDGNHLRVTDFGHRLLRGEAHLTLSRFVDTGELASRPLRTTASVPADHRLCRALFERLKELRLEIARGEGKPPYIIFSDASLKEMAEKRPSTEYDLLGINGIGEYKARRYGPAFLEAIAKFEK